jgi:hypothetical protein
MPAADDEKHDWEVDASGLFVATRSFLIRRGYCCANQCRNCPYINWRNTPGWQSAPADAVRKALVSPRALDGAEAGLAYHKEQLGRPGGAETERAYHRVMLEHYRVLLERWKESTR